MNPVYRVADAGAEMATLGATVHHVGCFLACIDPACDFPALNYAAPWASPWSYEQVRLGIARLREIFAAANRRPRIEFLDEAWPWLGPVLSDCGLERICETNLMLCTPLTFVDGPAGDVRMPPPQADFLAVQNGVFPEDPGDLATIAYQMEQGFWRCAVAYDGGAPVAAASLVPQGRTAELAAMATLPDHRRRGFASAVARGLLRRHFAGSGDLVWLAVANADAVPLYTGLGFRQAGKRVHYRAANGS